MELDRRELLGCLIGLGGICLCPHCKPEPSSTKRVSWFSRLPSNRKQALTAAVDRILPGAVSAGAMKYFEYWLDRPPFFSSQHEFNLAGLLLNRKAMKKHKKVFAVCDSQQKDDILKEFQLGKDKGKHFDSKEFFKRFVILTIESYFSDPKYGGNQNQVGWKLIGHHACWWSPKHVK